MLLEEEVIARAQAKKTPVGHLMITGGFRLGDTAVGYPIVWNNGQSSMVIKTHVWPQPEGIRRGCPPFFKGSRDRFATTDVSGTGASLYRRAGGHTDGVRRDWI